MASVRSLPSRLLRWGAGTVAGVGALPTSLCSVLRYYAKTGAFDPSVLQLKSTVEGRRERFVARAFERVDEALVEEFGVEDPAFAYDTKLLLPVDLTLAHLYRRVRAAAEGGDPVAEASLEEWSETATRPPGDGDRRLGESMDALVSTTERTNAMSELVVEALLDGDMRDAINDDEFEDFEVAFPAEGEERRRLAETAQAVLENRVTEKFEAFPAGVHEAYDAAVDYSEAHQGRDEVFREYATRAREGEEDAVEAIEAEYKHAAFEDEPAVFATEELSLPYLKTQYGRVGVIYDGMIDMYRAVGLPIDDEFKASIVLAIIGAQVWLDDVDDIGADASENQLTPVTAEYLLAASDEEAYERVIDVTRSYFRAARRYADASDSPLTGIAIEYILLSGDPSHLPGYTGDLPT
jgi:hypothetical protein